MKIQIDKGSHMLLGDERADKQQHGEAAWTLLADNVWTGHRHRPTKFQRMPYGAGSPYSRWAK